MYEVLQKQKPSLSNSEKPQDYSTVNVLKASAPAHAPYLPPYRQSFRSSAIAPASPKAPTFGVLPPA